jgi:hypothetical protein
MNDDLNLQPMNRACRLIRSVLQTSFPHVHWIVCPRESGSIEGQASTHVNIVGSADDDPSTEGSEAMPCFMLKVSTMNLIDEGCRFVHKSEVKATGQAIVAALQERVA